MQWTPPYDPKQYDLEPLLTRQGLTADWFTTDDGDPYGPTNVARWSSHQVTKLVPFRYRTAVGQRPELHQWIAALAAEARTEQGRRGAPVASVNRGPSLLLLGPTGVGKTYEAYGALRELGVTGIVARWTIVTAADLYAQLRPRHGIDSETEFQRYAKASILLVDDLGAGGKISEFTEDINFRLVNHRYENELPTLITSNVVPQELSARLGDRVASRLTEMCQRIVITGQDRRRQVAA
ncbi:ATP-binding protein [Streptomyces sp. A3M-1-3]|uniref:ATP-binding protein n=1 Tax=Streptomyces sp. A3M-1-3 TaxID=2962044 RepID=UPI0020B8231C|nr:ATP-binding protein [Streptomyces sp. A3M-1-3]MCP3820108.1 ATP-binding protein [Streptomyces sp. A3M-1-3]